MPEESISNIEVNNLDEVTKMAREEQKKIIKSVEDGSIKLETDIQRGNYAEMKMDDYFESQGFERLNKDRVTNLDAPTHQGIDGVYSNPNPPPQYIVVEAKYNKSGLGYTKDGKQMSDPWIEGRSRLEKAVGKELADEILVEGYDRLLFRVSPDGKITIKKLDAKGYVIK